MKTFIIDDDNIMHFLTKHLLQAAGYPGKLTSFLSAEEALEVLLRDMPANVPQVILLDLNMPGMNGWEFLDALTPYSGQLRGLCQIYILTSSVDLSDLAKSEMYDLVCGFMNKPIDQVSIETVMTQLNYQPANVITLPE